MKQLFNELFSIILVGSAFFMLAFQGCSAEEINTKQEKQKPSVNVYKTTDKRFLIVTIDSCEYVVYQEAWGYAGLGGICHKQNCKFCQDRNK